MRYNVNSSDVGQYYWSDVSQYYFKLYCVKKYGRMWYNVHSSDMGQYYRSDVSQYYFKLYCVKKYGTMRCNVHSNLSRLVRDGGKWGGGGGKGTYVLPVTQTADQQNHEHYDGQYSGLSMFQQL